MSSCVFSPPPPALLDIVGSSEKFCVRRIYCVGKNYRAHITEMGGDPKRTEPVFFTKSREALVKSGTTIPYPSQTQNLHFETELVVALGPDKDIFGCGVGLDMTRRDIQQKAKDKGGPWDMAKNFAQSAPCSALTPKARWLGADKAEISLFQNEKLVQNAPLNQMIWSVPEIINNLDQYVNLCAGDLIFTGTPEGVGPVKRGDHLLATIDGLSPLEIGYV